MLNIFWNNFFLVLKYSKTLTIHEGFSPFVLSLEFWQTQQKILFFKFVTRTKDSNDLALGNALVLLEASQFVFLNLTDNLVEKEETRSWKVVR